MTPATDSDFKYTEMMNTALRFINNTGRHIFLTGKAGTGKTTFLKQLALRTHKQMAIVAPTGIAALNAGGTTIHSQFLLPFGMFIPDRNYAEPPDEGANWYTESVLAKRHPLNSIRKQVLRSIDLLIIDEVSMLRADLLDAIDYRLRSVRNNFTQGFGGVQMLLIGDLYQLPPVVKRSEESKMNQFYKSVWFFESKALRQDGFTYIELDKISRQRDAEFITILNNLRQNCPTRQDLEVLNRYYLSPAEIENTREVITLTTHNAMADEMNQKALKELATASSFFNANVENDFPESMYPVMARLELKEGSQIMFTRNDSEEGAYYNGKLATVSSIAGDHVTVLMAGSGALYKLKKSVWENKKYAVNESTKELEETIVGSFSQYPVKLAWAITVHKSQGLTFDKAIIDVGQAFADGQVYVALSRLRSLDGLVLRTKVDPSIVTTDKLIVSFDQANNKPHVLNDEIKTQQWDFIQRQINRTFDFTSILRELNGITKNKENVDGFDEETMKSAIVKITETISAETGNTIRFREQLRNLIESRKTDEFELRLGKGAAYYKNLLWAELKKLALHIAEIRGQKRVKGYLTDLGDLDQLMFKKLEELDKITHIANGIINNVDNYDFSALTTERARLRSHMLEEIVEVVPSSSKPKKKKTEKNKTFQITIEMAESGMTATEIADERGLAVGTIETHLLKAVKSGQLNISHVVDSVSLQEISNAMSLMPEGFSLTDLVYSLNEKFSFGTVRAALFHLQDQSADIND